MKATRFGTLMALGTALSFFAVGCQLQNPRKIPPNQMPAPDIDHMPSLPPPLPGPTDTTITNIPLQDERGHTNWIAGDQLKDKTIHFMYDSSAIRSGDKSKVAEVADYLKENPQTAVRVEGNCDERGTEEYNRSLGERRALAAREELVRLGITPDRVDTLSYGEDKPLDSGHNEAAWKQNRRDDFILLTPPK